MNKPLEPYWCKCNHSRGYHGNCNTASLFSRVGSCTYDMCGCKKYKSTTKLFKKSPIEWLSLIPFLILNTVVLLYLAEYIEIGQVDWWAWHLNVFKLLLIYKGIQFGMIIIHVELTKNMFGQRERRIIKGIKDGVEPLEK